MLKRLLCLTIFAVLFFANISYSAPAVGENILIGNIYGIILDADTEEPIEGVQVIPKVKNSKSGKTDKNGRFCVKGRVGIAFYELSTGYSISISGGKATSTPTVSTSLKYVKLNDIDFSVLNPGYKVLTGNIPRYHSTSPTCENTIDIYVHTIYLAKNTSDKKSEYDKDFFDKNFVFSDISVSPEIITKDDKVSIKCKFKMPPEETLNIKLFVRNLITGRTTDLKKEIDANTKKETGYYTTEIKVGKHGLYPIALQSKGMVISKLSKDEVNYKTLLEAFTKSKDKKYILKYKTDQQKDVAPLFFSALEKLQKDEISQAEEDIRLALSKASDFAPYHWAQSLAYQEKGDYLKAIDSCEKSLKMDKNFLPAYLQLGLLYSTRMEDLKSKKDMQKKAEKKLDIVAEKAYKDIEFYKQIAEVYFVAELYDRAKEMYEKAQKLDKRDIEAENLKNISENTAKVSKNPKDAGAYYKIGSSYINLSMYDKAIENFKKAIDANPKYHQAFNELGEVYTVKDILDEAIDFFKKAVKLEPKQLEYRFNLASAYIEKGQDEEALKELDQIEFKEKKFLGIGVQEGEEKERLKEKYGFKKAFCQARVNVLKNPQDANANIEVVKYYFDDYDYDNVIKYCENAIKIGINSPDAYGYLGLAYAMLGKKDEALSNLEKGNSIEPNNSKVRAGFAILHQDSEDYSNAKTEWEQVIKLEKGKKSTLEKIAKEHLDELKKMK